VSNTKHKIRSGESLRRGLFDKSRNRREDILAIGTSGLGKLRNDLLPKLELVYRHADELVMPDRNVRILESAHIRAVMNSISIVGFVDPPLIDENNVVRDGIVRAEAARRLNLPRIPCILATDLTPNEKRIIRLALNRLSEKGGWDLPELKSELVELAELGIDIEDTAFTLVEFDQIAIDDQEDLVEQGTLAPHPLVPAVCQPGDVFELDQRHRVVCGDATKPETYVSLMDDELARLVLTDEPYNVPVVGHVTKGEHREFVMASGEMSLTEFQSFNSAWISASVEHLCNGGLIGTFIDWRGYPIVHAAAVAQSLTAINLIVWTKTNGGLGSLYRSQHELFPLYKKGSIPHVNNIELGKNGRWRSNVWSYPGASSIRSDSRKGLEVHPTVKPVAMLADAILDLSHRNNIVLDPFLGSGSTLIAAQGAGRRCCGIELDPRYVDVAINRYQSVYGMSAILKATGESFEEVSRRRKSEHPPE
jgi:DNA modification methylase